MSEQRTLIKWDLCNIKDKDLLNLIVCRKGGENTIKILECILQKPQNTNQVAKKLKLDYKTVAYHINIIEEHEYITAQTFQKRTYYYPSKKLFKSLKEYTLVKEYIKFKKQD